MQPPKFRALAISDLHIGCPRLDPLHLEACIRKYVIPAITEEVDYLFICGDFFDLSINMNSIASVVAMTVITLLKKTCRDNNVQLRVLRGTFTHDRNQPQHFLTTSHEYNDFVKVYNTLAIEYDEKTNMHFLYMPDNLISNDINMDVEELLASHGLNKVDIVVHHGYFKHMLPGEFIEPDNTLDYDKFKKYYSGCVLNGHVHIPSIYNNVVSVGSFDRMAYGEEDPKGFYQIDKCDGVYTFKFIVNEDAYPFITIDLSRFATGDNEKAIAWFIDNWQTKLNEMSSQYDRIGIRLISDSSELVEGIRSMVRDKLDRVTVDRKPMTKRDQIISNLTLSTEDLPEITQANIGELLVPIVQKRHPNITQQEIQSILADIVKTE